MKLELDRIPTVRRDWGNDQIAKAANYLVNVNLEINAVCILQWVGANATHCSIISSEEPLNEEEILMLSIIIDKNWFRDRYCFYS